MSRLRIGSLPPSMHPTICVHLRNLWMQRVSERNNHEKREKHGTGAPSQVTRIRVYWSPSIRGSIHGCHHRWPRMGWGGGWGEVNYRWRRFDRAEAGEAGDTAARPRCCPTLASEPPKPPYSFTLSNQVALKRCGNTLHAPTAHFPHFTTLCSFWSLAGPQGTVLGSPGCSRQRPFALGIGGHQPQNKHAQRPFECESPGPIGGPRQIHPR